jgi:hypothetical protein
MFTWFLKIWKGSFVKNILFRVNSINRVKIILDVLLYLFHSNFFAALIFLNDIPANYCLTSYDFAFLRIALFENSRWKYLQGILWLLIQTLIMNKSDFTRIFFFKALINFSFE